MYRYIYKITCTSGSFKDKFYFGQHTTENLNDGYKGSGKKLLKYYKKYPNDYIKEIICFCDSQEELNQVEYNIIHPWLNNKQCLNLKEGGIYRTSMSKESLDKMSKVHKNKTPWNKGVTGYHINMPKRGCVRTGPIKSHTVTDDWKKKLSEKSMGNKNRVGKLHTEDSKRKTHDTLTYRKWMTDGISKPIQIKPEYWGEFIDIGYHFGKK